MLVAWGYSYILKFVFKQSIYSAYMGGLIVVGIHHLLSVSFLAHTYLHIGDVVDIRRTVVFHVFNQHRLTSVSEIIIFCTRVCKIILVLFFYVYKKRGFM